MLAQLYTYQRSVLMTKALSEVWKDPCNATIVATIYGDNEVRATGEQHHDTRKHRVTFTIDDDALNWTGDGEYLRIEPWGTNSVRVRSRLMQPVIDADWALLEAKADPQK